MPEPTGAEQRVLRTLRAPGLDTGQAGGEGMKMFDWLLDELCRSAPEYKRVVEVGLSHYYALLKAGETIAQCSCHPHADDAVAIIEAELKTTFPRRYPK